jgi:nitrogenase molybdenum-cofactor synthesis protein NifE
MLSGGRTQFIALKAKTPWLDINQERHHPYAGYDGMVELVRQIDLAIHNPVWAQARAPAPWDAPSRPSARPAESGAQTIALTRRKFAATAADELGEC